MVLERLGLFLRPLQPQPPPLVHDERVPHPVLDGLRREPGITFPDIVSSLHLIVEELWWRRMLGTLVWGEGGDVDWHKASKLVGVLRREDHPHHAADAVADEDVRDESKLPVAIAHDFCVLPEAYGLPRLFRVAVVEDIEGEDLILLLERVRELVEAVSVHLHTVKKDQLGPSAAPEEVVELVAP